MKIAERLLLAGLLASSACGGGSENAVPSGQWKLALSGSKYSSGELSIAPARNEPLE